jgi:hypothetical protein
VIEDQHRRPDAPSAERRKRAGLPASRERIFKVALYVVIAIFAAGWTAAIANTGNTQAADALRAAVTTSPLSPNAPPPNAYLLDAAFQEMASANGYTGESKQLKVVVRAPGDTLPVPDSLAQEIGFAPAANGAAHAPPSSANLKAQPDAPGIWNMLVRVRDGLKIVPDLSVITLVPLSEKKNGRIGNYVVGSWPYENGARPRSPVYAPPRGLIRVMPENLNLPVSQHFKLGDFVTKGQNDVWPKYVAMSTRLLDKLELTIDELEKTGTPVEHIGVISGFRTPSYN